MKGLWGLVWLHCAPSRACFASFETPDAKGQGDAPPGASVGAPEPASALGAFLRSGQALRDAPPIEARLRALIEREALGEEAACPWSCGRPEMAPQRLEKIEFAPGNGAAGGPVDPQARGLPSSIGSGQAECVSPGNGAASLWNRTKRARKWPPRSASRAARGSSSPMKSLRRDREGSLRAPPSHRGDLPWGPRRACIDARRPKLHDRRRNRTRTHDR